MSAGISHPIHFWFLAANQKSSTGRAGLSGQDMMELFTQRGLDNAGCTGDTEEHERESGTGLFDGALSALLTMLPWL